MECKWLHSRSRIEPCELMPVYGDKRGDQSEPDITRIVCIMMKCTSISHILELGLKVTARQWVWKYHDVNTLLEQLRRWLLLMVLMQSMDIGYLIECQMVVKYTEILEAMTILQRLSYPMTISGYHWLQSQFVGSISHFIPIGTLRYPSWHRRITSLLQTTIDCWRRN